MDTIWCQGNSDCVVRILTSFVAAFPKAKDDGEQEGAATLPQTLVRIPIQQAEAARKDAEVSETAGE